MWVRSTFEAFAEANPDMYKHVMVLLARRLRDTNNALAATSFLSVKGRVARALLSLAKQARKASSFWNCVSLPKSGS